MEDRAKRRRGARVLDEPTGVILYRTSERWRFSLSLAAGSGFACGTLEHPDPTSDAVLAQESMHRQLREITGQPVDIDWQAGDRPDCWNGTVRRPTAAV